MPTEFAGILWLSSATFSLNSSSVAQPVFHGTAIMALSPAKCHVRGGYCHVPRSGVRYMRYMSQPLSLRLPDATLDRLGDRTRSRNVAPRTLAQRYVEEGLRTDEHPLIRFVDGPAGRRPRLKAPDSMFGRSSRSSATTTATSEPRPSTCRSRSAWSKRPSPITAHTRMRSTSGSTSTRVRARRHIRPRSPGNKRSSVGAAARRDVLAARRCAGNCALAGMTPSRSPSVTSGNHCLIPTPSRSRGTSSVAS